MMNTKLHNNAINKIARALKHLKSLAQATDQNNKGNNSHKLIQEKLIFNESLFRCDTDMFIDYVHEIHENNQNLSRLLSEKKSSLALALLEKIETQIEALSNALNANTLMHNEAQLHASKVKEAKKNRYQKAAQALISSSQQLYQSLSEHHEFERRLMDMLANKEKELSSNARTQNPLLSQEILALHQRLGRCRQAISKIERNIELTEKRSS